MEAIANPGQDYRWDRRWEILGLIWRQGLGEGQLEGQEIVKLVPARRSQWQREQLFEYFLRFGADIDSKRFSELGLSQIKSGIDALNRELPRLSRARDVKSFAGGGGGQNGQLSTVYSVILVLFAPQVATPRLSKWPLGCEPC